MIKIGVHAARDRQFRTLKKISKQLAQHFELAIEEVEAFVLKQEFYRALFYADQPELFLHDFRRHMEIRMGANKPSRQAQLRRRIWGPL